MNLRSTTGVGSWAAPAPGRPEGSAVGWAKLFFGMGCIFAPLIHKQMVKNGYYYFEREGHIRLERKELQKKKQLKDVEYPWTGII